LTLHSVKYRQDTVHINLDCEHIQTQIYSQLSVAGHLTIFLSRKRGSFWSYYAPRQFSADSVRSATGGDCDSGLWGIYALGLSSVRLEFCAGLIPRE